MQTSRASAISAREAEQTAPADARAHVWISHFGPDLHFVRRIAKVLDELGYVVAPYDILNYAHLPREKLTPNDARCVIALWTPNALEDKQIQADARTAGIRHALIEIGFRGACPDRRFSEAGLINFTRFDNAPHGPQWRDLLARVQALCGPPPKRPLELLEKAPMALAALATLLGGGAAVTMINDMAHDRHEAAGRSFAPPASQEINSEVLATAKRPSLTPTAGLGVDLNADLGGPRDYIALDLGKAPDAPPALSSVETPKPSPAERGPQGPEQ